MTRYETAPTARGNVGVSYESQAIAQAQAETMDAFYCTDCTGCTRCTRCTGCTRCTRCTGCTGCTDCTGCTGCTGCTDCTGCTRCTGCTGCTGCTRCTDCTGCTGCELYYLSEPSKITRAEAVANLDRVREIILDQPARLEMGHWHGAYGWQEKTCAEEATCGTTHCLAGWLQVCTTDPALRRADPQTAGAVLAPMASKMFFRGSSEVMTWLQGRDYAKEPA